MGAFRMGENGKFEAWAEEQVEAIEKIEAESTLNLVRQRFATSAMAKVIWLMFAQVNLRVKLSWLASVPHLFRPKHVFVLCSKNSPRLT